MGAFLTAVKRRALSAVVVVALAVGCESPTLPLPPPALPDVSISTQAGKFHLASTRGAQPDAVIVILNRNPNIPRDQRVSGSQADDEGTWEADVLASPNDVLDITQEFGIERSPPVTVVIPTH
jgi:hypothetical protein